MSDRTYPRAKNLDLIRNWLRVLTQYDVPLIEISDRKISDRVDEGEINEEVVNDVQAWKEEKGIGSGDENEYRYFLSHLSIIDDRSIDTKTDLIIPIGGDGPLMSELLPDPSGRERMFYLTEYGDRLAQTVKEGLNLQYEGLLWWLLLRCETFRPILQRTISDPSLYDEPVTENIPTRDDVSESCTVEWLQYFSLLDEDGSLRGSEVGRSLAVALAFELDEYVNSHEGDVVIEEWLSDVRQLFQLSDGVFDLTAALELVYEANREEMDALTAGRNIKSLPNYSDSQILSVKTSINPPFNTGRPSQLLAIVPD